MGFLCIDSAEPLEFPDCHAIFLADLVRGFRLDHGRVRVVND